jgi:hypothetical protein
MTAILERRESESLWGRFCNWITRFPSLYSRCFASCRRASDLISNDEEEEQEE